MCNYLQSIEKLQAELDSKVRGLDELSSKMTDILDQNRFLEVIQVS
jgi:hypothetical protein